MDNIVIQMIILLLLVVAGFVSNRCGLMGGDFDRKLSGFIINVSCSLSYHIVSDGRRFFPTGA